MTETESVMKFSLVIESDNAAFEDEEELSRIVREMAEVLPLVRNGQDHAAGGSVRDVNGNVVGSWAVEV